MLAFLNHLIRVGNETALLFGFSLSTHRYASNSPIVKQAEDAYEIYDGIHEAIVTEEMWYEAYAKRKVTGIKHEKTHSIGHYHMLSGLVRCPECGAKMYGVVNRKKKKGSDEFYKDMWYYKCKNRIKVEGKPCSYKTNIRQDQLNAELIALVRWIVNTSNYKEQVVAAADGKNDTLEELRAEEERLQAERKKVESRKKKLLAKIGSMDADDDLYDELCEDYMKIVRDLTEQIAKIDANLVRNRLVKEKAEKQAFSKERYYRVLDWMMNNIEELPEEDRKGVMETFIERIEIFPNREERGRWLKYVRLQFPLEHDGERSDEIWFKDSADELTENEIPIPYPIEQQSRRYVYCPNFMQTNILR